MTQHPAQDIVLRAEGLCKEYKLYPSPRARLKALLTGRATHRSHWALRDVSFTLHRGQCIGVIGDTLTYFNKPTAIDGGILGGGITTKDGIEQTIVFAGKGKDLGNPFRRPTKEELKRLQDDIDYEYDLFVKHVAENRNIEQKTIREQMGAHVFDNESAKKFGLINGTLNYRESVKRLAELAQIQTDDYQLVQTADKHHGLLSSLLGVFKPKSSPKVSPLKSQFCNKFTRLPLAYYGNPAKICSF